MVSPLLSVAGSGQLQASRAATYDEFADTYDKLDAGIAADALGLLSLRRDLLARAAGAVLETGSGTGAATRSLSSRYHRISYVFVPS
jgi:hypothetical protein